MRFLILAVATSLTTASAAAPLDESAELKVLEPIRSIRALNPSAAIRSDCPPISRYHARKEGERLGLRRLNELPDADHYKTAYRKIDGCEAPIVADFGVTRR